MADSKITALTAISTVDPTADPLVIVDVSDTSMAASGTTKKSTINQLLGAGGTATLASATITGDLTVDTNTLKVDSTNNRVGIGTASPAVALDVVGAATITGALTGQSSASFYTGTALPLHIRNSGTSFTQIGDNGTIGAGTAFIVGSSDASLRFQCSGSEQMRLNATGLGVGISPIYKLHVKSDLSELYFRDNGTASELLINSETGGKSALYFGDVADVIRGGIVYDSATDSLDIRGYNNVSRLQIDSVGNVVSNVTATAPTLSTNSQMVFNLTSNTNLRISVRGTDGVTRTANITLA